MDVPLGETIKLAVRVNEPPGIWMFRWHILRPLRAWHAGADAAPAARLAIYWVFRYRRKLFGPTSAA